MDGKYLYLLLEYIFKAMATLNQQKALTMNLLENIHKSLESCPTEVDQCVDPKYLKVELMPHQRHALLWLTWREKQRPSGGILGENNNSIFVKQRYKQRKIL